MKTKNSPGERRHIEFTTAATAARAAAWRHLSFWKLPQLVLLMLAFSLSFAEPARADLCAPTSSSQEVTPGVKYYDCSAKDVKVHIVTIDRSMTGVQLKILAESSDKPDVFLLRQLKDLAKRENAIAAINGYYWGPFLSKGHYCYLPFINCTWGTPTTTVFVDGVQRTQHSGADPEVLMGFRNTDYSGLDVSYFTDLGAPESLPFHQWMYGSGKSVFTHLPKLDPNTKKPIVDPNTNQPILETKCHDSPPYPVPPWLPTDPNNPPDAPWELSVLGYSDTQIIFLTSVDKIAISPQLCETLKNFQVVNSILNDNGASSALYTNGNVNVYQEPGGSGRYIAYGIGLVPNPYARPPLQWHHSNVTGLGDGTAAIPTDTPHAYTVGNSVRVVYRGPDNGIKHLYDIKDTWHYDDLTVAAGDSGATNNAASAPHGYSLSTDNSQHVVYLSSDKRIHEMYNVVGKWIHNDLTAAASATGAIANAASAPYGYIWNVDNSQHVVYRGEDKRIHELYFTNGKWTHNDLTAAASGTGAIANAASAPHGYIWSVDNSQHVVYSGEDKRIHVLFFANGKWTHNDLMTSSGAPPADGELGAPRGYDLNGTQRIVYSNNVTQTYPGAHELHELVFSNGQWSHSTLYKGSDYFIHSDMGGYAWNGSGHTLFRDLNATVRELYNGDGTWRLNNLTASVSGANEDKDYNGPGYSYSFPSGVYGITSNIDNSQRVYYAGSSGDIHELWYRAESSTPPGGGPGPGPAIDTTPPTTTASAPSPNAAGWYRTNVTINFNAVDTGPTVSGVKSISVSLSGAQNGTTVILGSSGSITVTAEGTTHVSYFAIDNAGNFEPPKTLTLNIDKTPPSIAGMPAAGCALWPPNHKLVEVATVSAADSLSGMAAFDVGSRSNEAAGNHGPVSVIAGAGLQPRTIQLRAERSGNGSGRVYTISATASDIAGNVANASASCTVAHDQGNK